MLNNKKYEYYDGNEELHVFSSYTKMMNYIKEDAPEYYEYLIQQRLEAKNGRKDLDTKIVEEMEKQNSDCKTK